MATEFVTLAWHVRAVTSDDEWGTEKEEAYESDLTWEEKVVEPETENQQTMLQNSTNGLSRENMRGNLSSKTCIWSFWPRYQTMSILIG
ncbi:hypothetical protein ACSQ67_024758 [Phaseolus vulgaris]